MKKIDELIEKLCPNGVEFKKLGNICNIIVGFPFRSILFKSKGFPIVKTTNIQDGYISEKNMSYFDINDYATNLEQYIIYPNDIVLGMSGTIKVGINNSNKQYYLNQRVCKFNPYNELNNKFLYYVLSNSINELFTVTSGNSIKNLSNESIKSLYIPLPPLEIQCEIVCILDKFTSLVVELKKLLKEELKARKKQYEYYKEKLLTFDDAIPRKKLIDIASISRGKRVTKRELNNDEKYPVYQNSLAPMGYYHSYNYEKNKTYVISAGSAGEIGFSEDNFWAADDCLVIHDLGEVLDKYVYYYLMLKQEDIRSNVRKASIPRLPKEIIENIEIPIPPIKKQKEIVCILDKIDKSCNDLCNNLSVEIEARQKQYEFYRDKLLTFKKLQNEQS